MPSVRNVAVAIFLVILCFGLSGCRSVQSKDMIGSYQLKAEWGCGSILLREDNTFHQEVKLGCSQSSQTIDGVWTPDGSSISKVTLKPFWNHDSTGTLKRYEYDDLPVEQSLWGPLRIIVNPDAGFSYEKQK